MKGRRNGLVEVTKEGGEQKPRGQTPAETTAQEAALMSRTEGLRDKNTHVLLHLRRNSV